VGSSRVVTIYSNPSYTEIYSLALHDALPISLWIATRGDLTFRTAGEVADGIIIATYANAPGIREVLKMIEEGVAKSGRQLGDLRSEEHTSELQSRENLVCRLLLEKQNTQTT